MKSAVVNFVKRHFKVIFLAGLTGAVAVGAGTGTSSPVCSLFTIGLPIIFTSAQAADTAPSAKAPAWKLKDVDGKTVQSSDFAGKVIILNFWATWCPPCVAEIPDLIELQKQYGPKGLVVIGVSVDDGPEVVRPFMKKVGMNYPIVMASDKILRDYGNIEMFPTTLIINRKGSIVDGFVGIGSKKDFEKAITPLF